jgi:hippurate hydrolase
MNVALKDLEGRQATIAGWRHHLHRQPELSLEEAETARYIAGLVKSWGYDVAEGVGKHGVVASLTAGSGKKSIGLRADTDALPIAEDNDLPYKSAVAGVAHLCGHDGHSTMLLAAGEYLARTRNFSGTVRLIFQPAEEIMAGGPAMIEDGLFDRWPVDAVFGMHNMPGLESGTLHFRDGAMMAAVDNWEIELIGKGSHGSMPELGIDPVVAGSSLVLALQTIVSRNMSPHHRAVVTVGAFLAGDAGNVIAQSAILRLSIRTTTPEDRTLVLDKVTSITKAQAESFGCSCDIRQGVPGAVLVNDPVETARAAAIARDAFGDGAVRYPGPSYLGSDDFAFMLQKRAGTYCLLGNGDTPMVHHPQYVFNDAILPVGAAYWVALTEQYLREPPPANDAVKPAD